MDETTLRQLIAEGAKGSTGTGTGGGTDSGSDGDGRLAGLVTLLNAAAASPVPGPAAHQRGALAAEDAAFAAFLAAHSEASMASEVPGSTGSPRSTGPGRRRRLGRRGRSTLLGIAAVGLIGGGAAIATGSGPFDFHAEGRAGGPQPGPAVTTTAVPPPGRPSPGGTAPSAEPSSADGSAQGTPGADPGPDGTDTGPVAPSGPDARLTALCRALDERPASARGKALGTSRFRPLVDAAGSRGAVDAHCAALLADSTGPAGSTGSSAGSATGSATGSPDDRPTGRPDDPGAGRPGNATGGKDAHSS